MVQAAHKSHNFGKTPKYRVLKCKLFENSQKKLYCFVQFLPDFDPLIEGVFQKNHAPSKERRNAHAERRLGETAQIAAGMGVVR